MTTSTNLLSGLIIFLVVSGVLGMANLAVKDYNEDATFADGDNALDQYGNRSAWTVNEFSADDLPESEDSVSAESGTAFTDLFKTAKNWIIGTTGVQYVIGILGAPAQLLNGMNLPASVVWFIATVWYGIFIFLIISWLFNR
jgi:hypothetical protein